MSRQEYGGEPGGCAALVAAAFVLGVVIAGLISLAALVDPLWGMPSVGEVWGECEDDFLTERDRVRAGQPVLLVLVTRRP